MLLAINKSHGECLLNCAVVIHHALELISGSVNGGEICMVPSGNLTNILISIFGETKSREVPLMRCL